MSKAIEDLKHEHEAILSALHILKSIIERIKNNKEFNNEDIREFIGFLKEFADKCHHGKEEGILFPELITAGMPEKGGQIEELLMEHVQGRNYITEMENAVSDGPNSNKLIESSNKYILLLTKHIQNENNILFPSVEKVLPQYKLDHIYEAFEKHENKVIGQGRHEKLHEMLNDLKNRYSE